MDSTEAAFVMNLTSILLKVAERLVRAGADVRRCRNAERFKTNSETFDAIDIYMIYIIITFLCVVC